MNFGDYKEMREFARWRLAKSNTNFQRDPAQPDKTRVIYLSPIIRTCIGNSRWPPNVKSTLRARWPCSRCLAR